MYNLICMNKIKQITAVAILFLSLSGNFVHCFADEYLQNTNASVTDTDISAGNTEIGENEDIFAPIDLDLTDYTYMNKKNKKLILFSCYYKIS